MNSASNSGPVIIAENVRKVYTDAGHNVGVLNDVSLTLERGERLAIIGSSGAGKSTLLNLLGGLDVATSGKIFVDGHNLAALDADARGKLRNRCVGFVYQFHHLLGEFTALENVAIPLLIAGVNRSQAEAQAAEMLERVKLGDRIKHKPAELSGGERQRVAIARAIVTQPDCVLMDEPTGNLDEDTAATIQELLSDLNNTIGLSFILVTHDRKLAYSMDRVLELHSGSLRQVEKN